MLKLYLLIILLLFFINFSESNAQIHNDNDTTISKNAIRVFFDCSFCNLDYIRQQITYINYVRDPANAQVFILGTSQSTGSGGIEYTMTFNGKNEFEGMKDTLIFNSGPNSTEEQIRTIYLNKIKIGLIRYIAKTPLSDRLIIDYKDSDNNTKVEDKWDNWVFRLDLSGNFNGDELKRYISMYSSLNVSRITPDWKIELSGSNSYNESFYKNVGVDSNGIQTTSNVLSVTRSYSFNSLAVGSLDDHWSLGCRFELYSSTYSNIKFQWFTAAAAEFNLFPYSESSRRQLRFQFPIGFVHKYYVDSTIYDKLDEGIFLTNPSVAFEMKEEWGSVSSSINSKFYPDDLRKFSLSLWNELDIRVFEGFTFNIGGNISLIRNQIELSKMELSEIDVLTQRRQNASNYSYYGYIGISYTFGSIYNNVVNPRFGG